MDANTLEHAMKFLIQRDSYVSKPNVYVIANGELHLINYSKIPIAVICNTSDRRSGGEHWLLFMIIRPLEIIYFDSFAEPLCKYNLDLPNLFVKSKIIANPCQVQPLESTTCGLFTLYVFYHIIKGRLFIDVIDNDFSTCNLKYNDTLVISFYNSLCFCVKRKCVKLKQDDRRKKNRNKIF